MAIKIFSLAFISSVNILYFTISRRALYCHSFISFYTQKRTKILAKHSLKLLSCNNVSFFFFCFILS